MFVLNFRMMKKNIFLIIGIFFLLPVAFGQPGTIDATFNPLDSGFWKGNGLNGNITASFVQNDGKFIVAGNFSMFNELNVARIARFNADGTLDATFNKTGISATNIQKVLAQPDGKIAIAGGFSSYNGMPRKCIARLNADGSLDNTFDPEVGFSPYLFGAVAMVLQTDGKLIVGGYFNKYNGTNVNNIVRINTDGKLDATFQTGTGFDYPVVALALQSDGKVIVGGEFTTYNNLPCNSILRLNSDGTKDVAFNSGSGPDAQIQSILFQDNGKLLITGAFKKYNGTPREGIAELNADGSLDNSFTVAPGKVIGALMELCKQPDGKIIASEALDATGGGSQLIRLNADGSLDKSFYSGLANNNARAIHVQSDGKIIVGGSFTSYDGVLRNYIARLNPDGTVDNSSYTVSGMGVNGTVMTSAIQSNGKIMIAGMFASYNGKQMGNIARINTDGSVDTTFHTGIGTNDWIESIAIQPDQKILIAGYFTKYKGVPQIRLARLNADGSLDATLNVNAGFNGVVEHVSVQQDGKIIVAGAFSSYNSIAANGIIRLQTNGSVDASFKSKLSISGGNIWTTLIQPDGKIILGGIFSGAAGVVSTNNIARLNSDGSIDASFITGTGTDNMIYTLRLQQDGSIIMGGQFKKYNGLPARSIARITANGKLDGSFSSGAGIVLGSTINSIALQQNGKIIVAGTFSYFNGTVANSLLRLNSDGSLDNTFNNISGATNKTVYTTALEQDGNIIIGGLFTDYNGIGRNNVARVIGGDITNIEIHEGENSLRIYPNPSNGEFTIEAEHIGKISIVDNLGSVILEQNTTSKNELINLTNVASGIYFLRSSSAYGQTIKKIIISK